MTTTQTTTTPGAVTGLPPAPLAKRPRVLGFDPAPVAPREGIRLTHRARLIGVPAGHVLENGQTVKNPFNVVLQFGVRWHPERGEPHIQFQAWHSLPLGDAIGFAGTAALRWLADPLERAACDALANDHGQPLATAHEATLAMVDALGLDVPTEPEPVASFILPSQRIGNA